MKNKPFLGRDPATGVWLEWQIQAYIIQEARRAGYDNLVADREEAGKVRGARGKAMGRRAGEPDMRLYLTGGRVVHIELKAENGVVSEEQEKRHSELMALGHKVHVVWAANPEDGWNQVREIIEDEIDA